MAPRHVAYGQFWRVRIRQLDSRQHEGLGDPGGDIERPQLPVAQLKRAHFADRAWLASAVVDDADALARLSGPGQPASEGALPSATYPSIQSMVGKTT